MSDVTIYTFRPEFNPYIYVHNTNDGTKYPVNPNYCATDKCASELTVIYKSYEPKIVKASPTGPMGGFFYADLVPAFEITKDGATVVILAGWLATYFQYFGPTGGLSAGIQEIENSLKTARGEV